MVSNPAKSMMAVFGSCVIFRAHIRHMGSSETGKKHDPGQGRRQLGEVARDDCKMYTGGLLDWRWCQPNYASTYKIPFSLRLLLWTAVSNRSTAACPMDRGENSMSASILEWMPWSAGICPCQELEVTGNFAHDRRPVRQASLGTSQWSRNVWWTCKNPDSY